MNEPEPLNLSRLLRQATQEAHQRLEAQLPLMRPDLTEQDYRSHVRALAPLVTAFELELGPHQPLLCALDGGEALTPRAHLVQHDAHVLGVAPACVLVALIRAQLVGLGSSWPQAAGCHYVLQGSRLGGQLIYRHLKKVIPRAQHEALSYYGACGAAQARGFSRWMRALDADTLLWSQRAFVVDAAVRTFAIWHQTLCHKELKDGTP